jgi:hypothetical protein
MSATLRTTLAAAGGLWTASTVAMAQAAGETAGDGFGGKELVLLAAMVLLLTGVGRFRGRDEEPLGRRGPRQV